MELISRNEAIKTARLMIGLTADERENEIKSLHVIEERKEGTWIDHRNEGYVVGHIFDMPIIEIDDEIWEALKPKVETMSLAKRGWITDDKEIL